MLVVETVEITVVVRLLLELLSLLAKETVDEVEVVEAEAVRLSFWFMVVVGVARRGFKRLPPPTKLCSGNCIGDLLDKGPIRGCFTDAVVEVALVDDDLTSISKGSILSRFFLLMFSITSFMLMVPL